MKLVSHVDKKYSLFLLYILIVPRIDMETHLDHFKLHTILYYFDCRLQDTDEKKITKYFRRKILS